MAFIYKYNYSYSWSNGYVFSWKLNFSMYVKVLLLFATKKVGFKQSYFLDPPKSKEIEWRCRKYFAKLAKWLPF